jgi:hypothetical protein
MKLAQGLHSHSTDAAISSARPSRAIGWLATASVMSSSPLAITSVTIAIVPGQIAFDSDPFVARTPTQHCWLARSSRASRRGTRHGREARRDRRAMSS